MNAIASSFVNQIIHTDCVKGMQRLPECCIPFTLTSPPYDNMREYGGHTFDFEAVASELWRITVPGGVVVWVVSEQIVNGTESGTAARQKLHFMDLGFRCSTMIMVSSRVRCPQRVRYPPVFDYAFVLTKGYPRYVHLIRDKRNRWAGTMHRWHVRDYSGEVVNRAPRSNKPIGKFGVRSNVWYYHVGGAKTTKDHIGHPALMPEAMAEDFIISFSRPGELVLDPFAGGGTTCKMAMLNNRCYLGMEIYEKYVLDTRKRLRDAREEHKRRLDATFFGDEDSSGTSE